jgi:hypothetical protein
MLCTRYSIFMSLTSQKSLNIKVKNRLRSTLREGVATLVLVKIQLFSNVNLETNISFRSCQYKSTSCGRMVPFETDRPTAALTLLLCLKFLCHTGFVLKKHFLCSLKHKDCYFLYLSDSNYTFNKRVISRFI